MSNALLNVLRQRTDIKGPAKAILYVFADRADDTTGKCWLSHASIAQESGLGKSTVRKHMKILKAGNEIRWTERFTSEGDRDSNLYVVTLGGRLPDSPPPPRDSTPTPPDSTGVGHEVAEGGSPRSYKAPIKPPTKAPEVSPEGLNFAEWFKSTLPASMNLTGNWQESFAKVHDDLVRLDKRSPDEIRAVCQWARNDPFWQTNFMSPAKLRKRNGDGITYFDSFAAKMKPAVGLKSKFAGTQQPELQMPT